MKTLSAMSLSQDIIDSIIHSDCDDIFAYLGAHVLDDTTYVVRAFLPGAKTVSLLEYETGSHLAELHEWQSSGYFELLAEGERPQRYLLEVDYGTHGPIKIEDPYRFNTSIGEQDLYLFGEGTHERLYDFLGAHLMELDGVKGCRFAVWAPNAKRVSVVGSFNHWDGRRHMMRKHIPSGIWEIFIPGLDQGEFYKYELRASDGSILPHKSDPVCFYAQLPPERASVIVNHDTYRWQDSDWSQRAELVTKHTSAVSIYELHLGSWKRVPEENNRYLTYREMAAELIPYVKSMGFTHIQLMPVSEFPFDGSWGYQPTGLFAPTSRFGSLDDFKFFVDSCHQADIAVLLDWVPGHFPTDDFGLGRFDGTPLYEHADSRQGFHPDWNTYIYNYGRREVRCFLLANALYWLDKFHIDGLRVDAVASMLYLDYSREEGDWVPNVYGGRENLDAIDFLRLVNERVYLKYPNAMMIAEESTAWPGVSKPTQYGGLGFGFKWNMGWMNDSLKYMSHEPVHRQFHHHDMTFSLYYAFSENYILPLSHDEVVHGKGSLIAKMPGDSWQKFANLRAYFGFMWTHPGKKLLFMGGEFAQGPEWDYRQSLSWHQLEIDEHKGIQNLVRDLNILYVSHDALYYDDSNEQGFQWMEADDRHNSVFAFVRKSSASGKSVIVVSNMTPIVRDGYRLGVDVPGDYKEILNTDDHKYGGSGVTNCGVLQSESLPWHYRASSIVLTLPALATVVVELVDQA